MDQDRSSTRSPTTNSTLANWWNRTRYQIYAPVYDLLACPLEPGRKHALERLAPAPEDRILILGSGPGSDLKHLPVGASITALESVPGMVHRTRKRAEQLGLEIDARLGDAEALPFEENAFDIVLLHLILSVVPDPDAVAAETARVLAPGGRVSIYDKFIPEDTDPSLLRWLLNPIARFLFSDLTRQLEPMFSNTPLVIDDDRETALGGLYTITIARPARDT